MKNIIIIAIAFLFASCSNKNSNTKVVTLDKNVVELTESQLKSIDLQTDTIKQRNIFSTLKLNGKIDVPPQNMVSVSVPLGGYIKSTKLLPGMHIQKGETIAVMEDQQYIQLQQDYLTTKAKLLFAEKELERQTELNKNQASSDKVLQQAQSDYTSLKVQLKSLGEKLRLIAINPSKLTEENISRSISIPSTIDGYVSEVFVNIGKYVNPTDVLFELVNPSDIHLALNVFEKDIDKLFIGQKLVAYTVNRPEKKYVCTILLIGRNFSSNKSVTVHCHFEQYDKLLVLGMFMNADVQVKASSGLAVPDVAIVQFEGKDYIFTHKSGNQFEMTEVNAGANSNGFTEITAANDLSAKQVVTNGAYSLLMSIKNKEE